MPEIFRFVFFYPYGEKADSLYLVILYCFLKNMHPQSRLDLKTYNNIVGI